jgi:phage shock protein C
MTRTLSRPRNGRIFAGVCAGIARRFGLSRFLVRLFFVLFGLFGIGEIVYIVLWVMMPNDPY